MTKAESSEAIQIFSLRDLIAQSGRREQGLLGECFAVDSESQLRAFEKPCRLDAFIVGVGTEGETTGSQNMKAYTMRKDTLFVFSPKNMLQTHSNNGFRCHVMLISPAFMQRIHLDLKHLLPLFLSFGANPCLEVTPEESRMLRSFITLIEEQLHAPENPFTYDILGGLIASTFYKVGEVLDHHLTHSQASDTASGDRSEAYFKQFMHLLGEHFRDQRSVSFYARQLCITPKYLTTLIKRISGLSVSTWIDNYVVMEAKTLLKYSDMSIQEIAYALNFSNQSFFGSYFKRSTGISPSRYRTTGGEGVQEFLEAVPAGVNRQQGVRKDSRHRS